MPAAIAVQLVYTQLDLTKYRVEGCNDMRTIENEFAAKAAAKRRANRTKKFFAGFDKAPVATTRRNEEIPVEEPGGCGGEDDLAQLDALIGEEAAAEEEQAELQDVVQEEEEEEEEEEAGEPGGGGGGGSDSGEDDEEEGHSDSSDSDEGPPRAVWNEFGDNFVRNSRDPDDIWGAAQTHERRLAFRCIFRVGGSCCGVNLLL
jgi:hypothetical protein